MTSSSLTPAAEVVAVVPELAGRTVAVGDELSWVWFPERTLPQGHDEPDEADLAHFWDATAFVVDVVFTDGSCVGDTATDQYGNALTSDAQAAARDVYNRMVRVNLCSRFCLPMCAEHEERAGASFVKAIGMH